MSEKMLKTVFDLTDDDLHFDHIDPKSLSSSNQGQLMCGPCNSRKGNSTQALVGAGKNE